jgi:hypothetical protein
MYPHERSLVKKMDGKPFVLLGVNSDQTRDAAKDAATKEKLTWRSWFAGSGGGQIAQKYKIQGWPTLYILDAKGVIRHKYLGSPQPPETLDKNIEELLKEMEDAKSGSGSQ